MTQHTAGARDPRFDDLVGIDQKILAHGRHAQRRQRLRVATSQMRHRAIEAAGLGQHRHRRGTRSA